MNSIKSINILLLLLAIFGVTACATYGENGYYDESGFSVYAIPPPYYYPYFDEMWDYYPVTYVVNNGEREHFHHDVNEGEGEHFHHGVNEGEGEHFHHGVNEGEGEHFQHFNQGGEGHHFSGPSNMSHPAGRR